MKIVAIIPARYDSARFKGKPLAHICGKPMVQWVYEAAAKVRGISEVIVATDSRQILEAVEGFGGKARLTSSAHQSGTDRIAEVVRDLDCDIVTNIQADEPLINPLMIEEALLPLTQNKDIPMGTLKSSIKRLPELLDPNVVKVVTDSKDFAIYFSRAPIPYHRKGWDLKNQPRNFKHIGLYVYRRDFLLRFSKMESTPLEQIEGLEQLRALENGYQILVPTTQYDSFGVDTPEDLAEVKRRLGDVLEA